MSDSKNGNTANLKNLTRQANSKANAYLAYGMSKLAYVALAVRGIVRRIIYRPIKALGDFRNTHYLGNKIETKDAYN